MKLNIGYFYSEELNLYGDTGNIEILKQRALWRGIQAEVTYINSKTSLTHEQMSGINLVFMGGGPDAGQKKMYNDLIFRKGPVLTKYIENGGVALFICGSYQLMGNYYQAADGTKIPGLGVFDLYTKHPGHKKQRCVGNIACTLDPSIANDPVFINVSNIGERLVGFENHGGRTYYEASNSQLKPFAKVIKGFGNNLKDETEGALYKNSIGTYFHGPLLSKNPHLADFLIAKALKLEKLEKLDDTVINKAHSALLKRLT